MKLSVFIVLFLFYYASVQAQDKKPEQKEIELNSEAKKEKNKRQVEVFQCEQLYKIANDYYENGRFELAIQTIAPCARLNLNPVIKINILRLITFSYLYLDRFEAADRYIRLLLKFEPEYSLRVDDPAEFRNLYEKYRTFPFWSVSYYLSPNYSVVRPTRSYNLDNDNNRTAYTGLVNPISVGVGFYRWLNRARMSLNFSLYYTQRSFKAQKDLFNFDQSNGFSTLSFTSRYQTIGAPLTFNAYFKRRSKLSLTTGVGLETFFIYGSSLIDVSRTNSVLNPRTFDNLSQRKQLSYNAVAQIGVNYKIKRAYLQLILRYAYNFRSTVLANKRYTTSGSLQDLLYTYGHLDDDFFIDQIQVSFRYTRLFYNSKLYNARNR